MEALKAELAMKRKNLTDSSDRPNKYMRRGDIEKMEREKERKEAEEKAKAKAQQEVEKSRLDSAEAKVCFPSLGFSDG
jgi:pre-mRNA-splicing factor 18